jgi:hypothetical protein
MMNAGRMVVKPPLRLNILKGVSKTRINANALVNSVAFD